MNNHEKLRKEHINSLDMSKCFFVREVKGLTFKDKAIIAAIAAIIGSMCFYIF